jgi:hypothetical protein
VIREQAWPTSDLRIRGGVRVPLHEGALQIGLALIGARLDRFQQNHHVLLSS